MEKYNKNISPETWVREHLSDFKDELMMKYGYEEDLAREIALMGSNIISYLGYEYIDLVLESISSCKYLVAQKYKIIGDKKLQLPETIYDVLKREKLLKIDNKSLVDAGDLQRANGLFTSFPKIEYKDDAYKLKKIDRYIVLPYYFCGDNLDALGSMAHETLHLVKSYLKGYSIEGDVLVEKIGLATREYKLSGKTKPSMLLTKETGIGLEEGINTYDELGLMREIDENYDIKSINSNQRIAAGYIIDYLGLKSIIKRAQITKDDRELKEIFASCGYEEFLDILDKSLKLEYEIFASLEDSKKRSLIVQELDKQFEDKIAPMLGSLERSLKVEESKKHVIS